MQSVRRRCRCTQTAFALHAIRELHNLYTLQKLALTSYIPVCNNICLHFIAFFLQYTQCNAHTLRAGQSAKNCSVLNFSLQYLFAFSLHFIAFVCRTYTQTAFALKNVYRTQFLLHKLTRFHIPLFADYTCINLHCFAFFALH